MKKYTIRHVLFFSYSAIILIAFFTVAALFIGLELPRQRAQVFSSLQQSSNSITYAMDSELNQMHTLALNIAYSTLVHNRLAGHVYHGGTTDTSLLLESLAALTLPNFPVDQVFLYTLSDEVIASGLINDTFIGDSTQQPWFEAVQLSVHNSAVMYTGMHLELSRFSTSVYGKHFVTLALQIFDSLHRSQGYVEVMKSLSRVFPAAISFESVFGEQIFIFDECGTLIHPHNGTPPEALFSYAKEAGFPAEVTVLSSPGAQSYFACSPSSRSNFHTIAVISEEALLLPARMYTLRISLVTLVALVLALILAFFAAKRLTVPINNICDEVVSFDLLQPSTTNTDAALNTKVVELATLHQSFRDMKYKLTESANKQLLLQSQEMQSRMIALQAQMNPHFLYNSLSVMQSMADDGMNEEIIAMCQSMASILRYISSHPEQRVPLKSEIRHTKGYLNCMAARYQGDLSYTITLPAEMDDLDVPKLCVQLLVENAIKYSSVTQPPFHVSISGEHNEKYYSISVKDNGPGFSEESLQILNKKIAEIDATGLLPSLEIDGMGLLNVYIRYKLLSDGNHIFRLENHFPHGACVTIGEWYEKP